jgi:hypothetical protein
MKRDLVFYGKILLVTLTPGLLFLLFVVMGEGTAKSNQPFLALYIILASYLVLFGIVMIGLRFFVKKIGGWIRK